MGVRKVAEVNHRVFTPLYIDCHTSVINMLGVEDKVKAMTKEFRFYR